MRGSAKIARQLLKAFAIAEDAQSVRGFRYLGEGSTRIAYLGPDGMVYKIPTGDDDSIDAQMSEAGMHKAFHMPKGWRIAPSKLIWIDQTVPVVVMEYVNGIWEDADGRVLHEWPHERCVDDCRVRGLCYYKVLEKVEEDSGVYDLHVYQYLIEEDGTRVIFDYALTDLAAME